MTEDTQPEDQPTGDEKPQRYAVYDNTLQRFVGGTSDKRPSKAQVKERHGDAHDYEVREV